ncbi:MAG: vitamin B12-dependent ribonucleotide reductase [Desulfobacterales bacterium]|nr:vitamin B12-dependent ribonucleotide reductase [Desulfobacterales bacterium]MDX2513155.1 vitamin B12-dependent ribonucleotide reductase [Desulfobacterales bacterium]
MKLSLSKNARLVLEKRYLKKDDSGKAIESPENMFQRVAQSVAEADRLFDPDADVKKTEIQFQKLLANLWFLPNSPTMMNAGRRLGQLAACFVLPIEDSMESIFETVKNTAMIHKSGGGTGFSFSKIRPAKDVVLSTAGISSGPLSFMTVFDIATETVKQGGTRRGANMGVLRVDHPDIEAFIETKNDLNRLNNFNISVGLTKQFMDALDAKSDFDLINPRTNKTVQRVSARKVFDMIVRSAWNTGEPGILFIDKINDDNPTKQLGDIEATNPCGEQPLLPYESCTLGSINLSQMVTKNSINMKRLKKTVHDAVHFLDNVIEMNRYPLPQIEAMSKANRKIGLGVMGFADLLLKLEISYDSEEAIAQGESIMAFISSESKIASASLAEKRGNFKNYPGSIYDTADTPYMRNAATTTIAPTGTISIIAGVSSGIEPVFSIVQTRRVLEGETLHDVHPLFIKAAKAGRFFHNNLIDKMASGSTLAEIDEIPEHIKILFKTSHDISPEWHVRVQAAFQKHTDNAVSKTVNLPVEATEKEVEQIYLSAYRLGCKGVTIYRDGSRDKQVLNIGTGSKNKPTIAPRSRPLRTHGMTERIQTGCGKLYVTINSDTNGMCEVFAQMGKTGGCASSQIEAAGRLASLALRSGVNVDAIIRQLTGIRCPSPAWQNGKMILSCPDAMAQVLKNLTNSEVTESAVFMGGCPECGSVLSHEEGCLNCHSCGFSKCS